MFVLRDWAAFHDFHPVSNLRQILGIVSVQLCSTLYELAIDRMLDLMFHHYADGLVATAGRDETYAKGPWLTLF